MEKVKVLGDNVSVYDTPKYLDKLDGPVKDGDWVVYNNILCQYNALFVLSRQIFDYNKLIKVKKI